MIISPLGLSSACSMGCEGLILPMALHPGIRFTALAFSYVRYALLHTWRPSSFLSRFTYWRQTEVYHYTSFFVKRFRVTFSSLPDAGFLPKAFQFNEASCRLRQPYSFRVFSPKNGTHDIYSCQPTLLILFTKPNHRSLMNSSPMGRSREQL